MLFLSGEFLLHIRCPLSFSLGCFCYTSHAGTSFFLFFLLHFFSFFLFFSSGEFLLQPPPPPPPCYIHFSVGSLSKTSHFCLFLIWEVSLTHPMLPLFLSGKFLLHIPWLLYLSLGSFSYTSPASFIFIWGVSLIHPMLVCFLIWWVSLTHPLLASFLSGEFLLYIPCWFVF